MKQPALNLVDISDEALLKHVLELSTARDTLSFYQAFLCSTEDALARYKTSLGGLIGEFLPHKFVVSFVDMMNDARESNDPTVYELYRSLNRGYYASISNIARNNILEQMFENCFGLLPHALYSHCHCLMVRYPGIKFQSKHLLWACWVLKQHVRDDAWYGWNRENIPTFLKAESSLHMWEKSCDIIKMISQLFDETMGVPRLVETGEADLSLVSGEVMGAYYVRFSVLYWMMSSSHVRVIVSIPDNKVVDVSLSPAPGFRNNGRHLYASQLMDQIVSGGGKAIVVSGVNRYDLKVIAARGTLTYDNNPNARHLIHNEVCRLEELCRFFSSFRALTVDDDSYFHYSITHARPVALEALHYAKAIAFFANRMQKMTAQGNSVEEECHTEATN